MNCDEGACLSIRATLLAFSGTAQPSVSLPAGSVLIGSPTFHYFAQIFYEILLLAVFESARGSSFVTFKKF
jgi:hypothetical protein